MVAVEQLRYACRFVASAVVTFPLNGYEYDPSQGFRVADTPIPGVDYAYDYAGVSPWAKDVGIEPVRFLVVGGTLAQREAMVDGIINSCINGGLGALWTTDGAGAERWASAKLDSRPGAPSKTEFWGYTAVTLRFRRYSDWYRSAQASGSVALTASPQNFTINNPGLAPALLGVYTLRGTFDRPTFLNTSNLYSIGSLRAGTSANHRWRFNVKNYLTEWTSNAGTLWTPDYANLVRGAGQIAWLRMEPGDNAMRYSELGGTHSATFDWAFDAPNH